MSHTYDNDRLEGKDAVHLCVAASLVVRAIAGCLSCHSLLAAKMAVRAAKSALSDLKHWLKRVEADMG